MLFLKKPERVTSSVAAKMISLLLVILGFNVAAAQSVDSLETVLKNAKGKTAIVVHIQLAYAFDSKDWQKAVYHAKQGFDLAKNFGSDSLLFEANYIATKSFHGLGDYDQALAYGKSALALAFDARSNAAALQLLGRIYESRGEYQLALDSYLKAIQLHQSIGNKAGMANTLNSLSFVYKGMGQYQKAIDVLMEAKAIHEELGNKKRLAGVIFNIGLMTMEMNRYKEAIPYFRKAMQGLREVDEPYHFSSFYNNLANCYQKMMDKNPSYYDSAIYYGNKNLEMKKRFHDFRGIANAHNGLASTYKHAKNFAAAYAQALAALKIADSLKLKPIKKNALGYLVVSEIELKKIDRLSSHFAEYDAVTEELNEESSSQTLSEMATRYETEKKDAENQRLQHANAQQARLTWILAGGGALLLILLALLGYFFLGKQKINQQLASQNKQIESNLCEKESLLREIHHRVKNNLQVISSLLNMQSYYLDDPRMINAIAEGQNRVKAMALIHQKLYQTEHLSEIDFQEYTEQLIKHLATALGDSEKKIQSQVNGSALKLDIDTAIPLGLILNELITNAYKYAFQGANEGSLKVDLTQDESRFYHLRISDSGRGLPSDFSETKLNSLGLKLVRMLIEQLDGSLTISNEPGASFYIRFKESRLTA